MNTTSSYPAQSSPVTCGIAALAAVAARYQFPNYVLAPTPEVAAIQARLHRIAARTGLPWPRCLGTSPWALAALVGKLTGERYETRVWASSSNNFRLLRNFRSDWNCSPVRNFGLFWNLLSFRNHSSPHNHSSPRNQALHAVLQAVEANKDCFLYVGGPSGKPLQSWIPRHVVAVLGAESTETTLTIFEPSSGRIFRVLTDSLLASSGKARPEFGNWCYPLLIVVPAAAPAVEKEDRGRTFSAEANSTAEG
ncbi:MAG: hypothetical protein QM705_12050 [Ancrocorticia sp.]